MGTGVGYEASSYRLVVMDVETMTLVECVPASSSFASAPDAGSRFSLSSGQGTYVEGVVTDCKLSRDGQTVLIFRNPNVGLQSFLTFLLAISDARPACLRTLSCGLLPGRPRALFGTSTVMSRRASSSEDASAAPLTTMFFLVAKVSPLHLLERRTSADARRPILFRLSRLRLAPHDGRATRGPFGPRARGRQLYLLEAGRRRQKGCLCELRRRRACVSPSVICFFSFLSCLLLKSMPSQDHLGPCWTQASASPPRPLALYRTLAAFRPFASLCISSSSTSSSSQLVISLSMS